MGLATISQPFHSFNGLLHTDFKQDKPFCYSKELKGTKDLNLFCLPKSQYIVRIIKGYCLNEVQMTKGHLVTTPGLRYEPFHGFFLCDAMVGSNGALLFSALVNVVPSAFQDHVKVQTVNTDTRVIFDAQVDVFL